MLRALEDHLSTLVPMLVGLQSGDAAHVKDIAAKLRLLVCGSSGQEGLLWTLGGCVQADDRIHIRSGKWNVAHHFLGEAQLLDNYKLLNKPGTPIPMRSVSLREVISSHEVAFVAGVRLKYREVVKQLAEHVGTAHETPGVSLEMASANGVRIGDAHPFMPVIDRVARWALAFGEKVIQSAVQQAYVRRRAPAIAPPEVSLRLLRFSYPMDGPRVETCDQGRTLIVGLPGFVFARATAQATSLWFPPVRSGDATFSFEVTRRSPR